MALFTALVGLRQRARFKERRHVQREPQEGPREAPEQDQRDPASGVAEEVPEQDERMLVGETAEEVPQLEGREPAGQAEEEEQRPRQESTDGGVRNAVEPPAALALATEEQGHEFTYQVAVKRIAVRKGPSTQQEAVLVLHRGERVCGVPFKVDGIPWLGIRRETMEAHPNYSLLEQDVIYALVDATDTELDLGVLLERAPAELGWCAADKGKERSNIFEVIKSTHAWNKARDEDEDQTDVLLEGSLVKSLEVDEAAGRMRFQLQSGDGPEEGWVSLEHLERVSHRQAPAVPAPAAPAAARPAALPQDPARLEHALRSYGEACWQRPEDVQHPVYHREAFSWDLRGGKADAGKEAPSLSEDELRRELSLALATAAEADPAEAEPREEETPLTKRCKACHLPVGSDSFDHEGRAVHAECMARILLQEVKEEDDKRIGELQLKKRLRREEFQIGWKPERHIPGNAAPTAKLLGGKVVPDGMLALALAEDGAVTLVPTICPAAAVNLEYLSAALEVRRLEGREPFFSLDAVDPELQNTMQAKRFEPTWLKNTLAGDVLFEADYHLKELSFGEYEQPVVGMRSCWDFSADYEGSKEWAAREWFVIRHAQVELSEDGLLIPCVRMGVEAREQALKDGKMEDVKATRPDHPMVCYAEQFTHKFDLIAERKSVIFHLRELAKATILAKYLMESNSSENLGEVWWELFERHEGPSVLEVPQLWNERGGSLVTLRNNDRHVVSNNCGSSLFGGVEMCLERFRMGPRGGLGSTLKASRGIFPVRRGLGMASVLQGRRGLGHPRRGLGLARQGTSMSARPGLLAGPGDLRGVDLSLGKFDLSYTGPSTRKGPLALSESLDSCVTLGRGFWRQIDGNEASSLGEESNSAMKEIFNPFLSDRRTEGDLFMPPDTSFSYGTRLKALLDEEHEVRRKRKQHFFSAAFSVDSPGPLFPSAWTKAYTVSCGLLHKGSAAEAGLLQPRPDFEAVASQLRTALEDASPIFERTTEEGLRFCIYRLGSLEVRTTRAPGAEEEVGAVFTLGVPGAEAPPADGKPADAAEISAEEKLERATLFVERDPEDSSKYAGRFYVMLETDKGNVIVTEKLRDGSTTWQENPHGVAGRNSLAKVASTSDGLSASRGAAAVTVGVMRVFRASRDQGSSTPEARLGYAESAVSRAAPWARRPALLKEGETFESYAKRNYPRLFELLGLDEPRPSAAPSQGV